MSDQIIQIIIIILIDVAVTRNNIYFLNNFDQNLRILIAYLQLLTFIFVIIISCRLEL